MFDTTHTLRNERRDFVEWHRGRSPYVFWGIDFDAPALGLRLGEAAGALSGCLLDDYRRQPHVTLALCGFPAQAPLADDEFERRDLLAQVEALRGMAPFAVQVGGPDSFSSAPYLAVADVEGGIARVRQALMAGDFPGFSYVPHVTIGLYADAWPAAQIRSRLAAIPVREPLHCRIAELSLLAYAPDEIGGPLTCLGRYQLGRDEFSWSAAGLEISMAADWV